MPVLNVPTHSNLTVYNLFARFVRLAVFKFAILFQSTFIEKYILNRWQNHFSGYGYCGSKGNFSFSRAQSTVELFESLGASKEQIIPKDQEASLQVLTLSFSKFKSKVETLGGRFEKNGNKYVILEPNSPSCDWEKFRDGTLKRIFSEGMTEDGRKCFVSSDYADHIPENFQNRKIDCVLFSQLGTNYVMRKTSIGWFLGQGIDVAVYSTRGCLNSPGYISEGGLYNDIEAVAEHLFAGGYEPSKTCIYGSCGESFAAVQLFCKYHHQGINLILQKAPISLNKVIARINKIAAWIFGFFKNYLKAPKNSKCSSEKENFFNSKEKIQALKRSDKAGFVVLTKIKGDKMAPSNDVHEMGELLKEKGCEVTVLESHAKGSRAACRKKMKDPHLSNPLRNPEIQRKLVQHFYA